METKGLKLYSQILKLLAHQDKDEIDLALLNFLPSNLYQFLSKNQELSKTDLTESLSKSSIKNLKKSKTSLKSHLFSQSISYLEDLSSKLEESEKSKLSHTIKTLNTIFSAKLNSKPDQTPKPSSHNLQNSLSPNTNSPDIDINNFDLNIFNISLPPEQILFDFSFKSFTYWDLFNNFNIDLQVFNSFIFKIASGYKEVPYHNVLHSADVLQSSHIFLASTSLYSELTMTPLHSLALMFSAIIHDYKHPGVNNAYLKRTGSKLALKYNDNSILENYHLSQTFKVLKKEKYNVFHNISESDLSLLRKLVIFLVLQTDMAQHQGQLEVIRKKFILKNDLSQDLILSTFLHLADLSNTLRPFAICEEWGKRISSEFFIQGDLEKSHGLEVSSYCDRFSTNIAQNQIDFIDSVMIPFITPLCREIKELNFLYSNSKTNKLMWKEKIRV